MLLAAITIFYWALLLLLTNKEKLRANDLDHPEECNPLDDVTMMIVKTLNDHCCFMHTGGVHCSP